MRYEVAPTDISLYHILCLRLLVTLQIKTFDDNNFKFLIITINDKLYSFERVIKIKA